MAGNHSEKDDQPTISVGWIKPDERGGYGNKEADGVWVKTGQNSIHKLLSLLGDEGSVHGPALPSDSHPKVPLHRLIEA